MSHFGDFMEGVPVKISEKYIRPPRIELPYSVIESSQRSQTALENVNYYFKFEENVLGKLKELRSAKETKRNERRHRLQLLEEAKQKKLDAIAAVEAEERLKQLSVSEVSYPSTDEISEISPDDKTDNNCDTTLREQETQTTQPELAAQNDYNFPTCSTQQEPPLNILQPIQVQSNYQQNSLLDDPDPLQSLKMQSKAVQIPQYNPAYAKHHIDNLTYKDFENDTSSPFDNVELKTINEMELLAQVLQSQRDSSIECQQAPQYMPEQPYATVAGPNCATQAQIEGITYLPGAYIEQPIQGHPMMYTSPQHYPIHNGYYVPLDNSENVNMYMPNYQYYIQPNPYPVNTQYYSQPTEPSEINQVVPESTYIPQPYYFNYLQRPPVYQPAFIPNQATEINPNISTTSTQNTVKSRSRSVPDIVKELNEELARAKLRATERSYNASPAPKEVTRPSSSTERKERRSKRRTEQLPNPYEKLSDKLQSMCQKIHSMGFPLDRVARVCTLVGDNDKKVSLFSLLLVFSNSFLP